MKSSFDPLLGVLFAAVIFSIAVMQACGADIRDRFEKRVYRNAKEESLPYRLFIPMGYDAAKQYPLVLFLHGAGERGNDNAAQLRNGEFLRFASDKVQTEHPCFVLAPQCPDGHKWVEVPWDFRSSHKTPAEASMPMRLTMELLDKLDKEFSIDRTRRYVTGLSMGGFGALDLCVRRPNDFAAAMPICGGGDDSRAKEIAKIGFWVFHGGADPVVPVVRSRSIVKALKEAGADVRYSEYPGVGHNSWVKAYAEPELIDWTFRHKQ